MISWPYTTTTTLLLLLGAAAWPYWTYNSTDLRPPRLKINATGTTESGFIFIGPRGDVQPAGRAPLIYDNDGNLVYEGPEQVVANFRVQQLKGIDVITFWAGEMLPDMGYGYGSVHILDNTYQEIHTITLTDYFVTPDNSSKDSYIDMHESLITSQNTILVTAYNVTQHNLTSIGGGSADWILDSQFYEIDIETNQVLRSWSALDQGADIALTTSHKKLGVSVGTQNTPYDAYHINSIAVTSNGYFISLRHMWTGYYISQNGTVLWRISGEDGGDFAQVGDASFSWQHDMRIYNETETSLVVTLFSNGNTPTEHKGPSTGVSLAVDLVEKQVSRLRSLIDPDDIIRSVSQGSYQLLTQSDDHVFIGYGSISKVKEFDGEGNRIFSAQFGDDDTVASYRGYRYQWSAIPFWKPSIKVFPADDGATVYMSWNGATDYDNWVVYSATSETSVDNQRIGSVKRTGFETSVTLTNLSTTYFQVVACQGDRILGSSEIVSF